MITSEEEIRYWLALTAIPNVGIKGLLKTAQTYNTTLSNLLNVKSEELEALGWQSEQIACLREAHPFTQKCMTWLNGDSQRGIITYDCNEYPEQLKQIAQAPLLMFTDGDHRLLQQAQLAVVGSRGPTHSGLTNTNMLLSEVLMQSPLVITSGLALGIDAQSHQTALAFSQEEGLGRTIAVLGNGIDVVYPKRHAHLYEKIRQNGLLLSEFPPSVLPSPKLFPRRNRIISGLSLGTLVSEARIKSGSLVTAKYALEQGREVFAMPSNINNKQAEGCHWLIKQGAKLTECAQDIFDELPELSIKTVQKQEAEKKPKQNLASPRLLDSVGDTSNQDVVCKPEHYDEKDDSSLLLQAVDFDITPIDVIAKRTGQSVSTLFVQLLEYELRGFVTSTSEGYLKLRG
ncbi:DNA-processing protein DprA [Glaciecola sp. MF2-115]|uniref:DNA-processing protein DprA n=1 Tax=Glaciecola sp. MF2-115 TaxID=3384827 RepID=UPI00399FF25E